jgi:glycosyltransferase involved in cell wall biosynthesis
MVSGGRICERCQGRYYYNAILQRCVKGSLSFSVLNCLEAYIHKAIRIYDFVDLFISPSEFNRDKLMSFGVDARRIRLLRNFVELEPAPPAAPGGCVLYCGRLGREKGVLTLIKAVERQSDVNLVIAGSGGEEATIGQYVREKQIPNVRLVGFVSGEAKKQLFREASLCVVPSEWYENCSLSVLEAFAWGKPVVASRLGGLPEQVKPGFTGLLFEPGNVSDLGEKIRYLIAHPDEASTMGRNARTLIEQVYSPEAHYNKLTGIYQEAIARRRRGAARKLDKIYRMDGV